MSLMLLLQEQTHAFVRNPAEVGVEDTVINLVQWLKLTIEVSGAIIISIGFVVAAAKFLRSLSPPQITGYNEIRLTLARFLALSLEFQLGADILSTAIAPSWTEIGKLGAIAFIRTALNYFLAREMKEEREGITPDAPPAGDVMQDAVNR